MSLQAFHAFGQGHNQFSELGDQSGVISAVAIREWRHVDEQLCHSRGDFCQT